MSFEQTMDDIARGVEILGVATVLVGLAAALVTGALGLLGGEGPGSVYRTSEPSSHAAFCSGWSFWWPQTSSGPSPSSPRSRTLLSLG